MPPQSPEGHGGIHDQRVQGIRRVVEGEDPPQLCSLLARGSEKVRGQLSVVSGWSQDACF